MSASRRTGWALNCLLLMLLVASAVYLFRDKGPPFATLPILVPASTALEAQQRALRGQPVPVEPDEILSFLQALESELSGPVDPVLLARMDELRASRLSLLDARQRKHELNTSLMQVGVRVVHELDAEQWAAIHGRRDAHRKSRELPLNRQKIEVSP